MKAISALFLTSAVLTGAVLAGGIAAGAQSSSAPVNAAMKDGPMQGLERTAERSAERLLRQYDANHDGKITRAEMNGILGARFAAATHHAPDMSIEQFVAARAEEFRSSNEAMFHRLDWNGDGKLTLAEYAAPQHIRFVELDRNGAGAVFCGYDPSVRGGRGGMAGFCRENDLDMDGKVTRAELDQAIAKHFAAGAGKSGALTQSQFVAGEEQRYLPVNIRAFRRLDEDGSGSLTIQEYAASEIALFARLDKNGNGVLEPNELHPRQTRMAGNAHS